MPKRSRSGVVRRPVRVVAPTSVNGGRSSVSVRAAGPWHTTMSSRKSSSAGYRISSIAGVGGEGGEVEGEGGGRRSLAHDDVEPEVLERGIQDLLDRVVEAMDLVDEEHVARLEPGEDRRHVSLALERGPRDGAQAHPELLADDRRERRLPEPRRTDEQHVVQGVAAPPRGFERDVELLLDPLLPDELVEAPRPQRALDLLVALL